MIRRPPRSTRTDTLFPHTTLCRSDLFEKLELVIFVTERFAVEERDDPAPRQRRDLRCPALFDLGDDFGKREVCILGEQRLRDRSQALDSNGHQPRMSIFELAAHCLGFVARSPPEPRSEERRVGKECVST